MHSISPLAHDPTSDSRVLATLTALAFLSPGAWLITTLPSQPVAQLLHLATAALWLGAGAIGVRYVKLSKPLWAALVAVFGVAAVSLVLGASPLQQLVYDIYAEMPVVLWLVYPAVFLVAASVPFGPVLRRALVPTVLIATALVCVMVVWRWTAGFVTTFGSPAYSIPAFAPVPFLALALARTVPKRRGAYYSAALVVALGLAYAGGGLSALFMLGMGVLVTLAVAPQLLGMGPRLARPARIAGVVLLTAVCVALLVVEVPLIGSSVIGVADAGGAEQTVATRLYLWDAAQRMTADSPLFGFGPAGYRFSAVNYYNPGVFAFIAGAGSDPIAYSAPSPHSLLWEVLTRLGLAGLVAFAGLAAAWVAGVRGHVGEQQDAHDLRMGLVVGFVTYLMALMVTPVHFASGLLGAVVGGFAIAGARAEPGGDFPRADRSVTRTCLLAAVALALLAFGVWKMVGLGTGAITGQGDFADDRARIESAARIIPGEPLNERRLLEIRMWSATTPAELDEVRSAVDESPAYITGFAPNLVQFASIGMSRVEQWDAGDLSWERALLEKAQEVTPDLPSLVAEQLRLGVLEEDLEALPALTERATRLGATYPHTQEYLARAQALMRQ
ncbi:MAG: O-antigen ligase family protein [Coriobacteriia bacterium]|jgi:O-antigen ligase|nr:O-antigen ligase family protein [Coriobacteriia bacterium]